MRPVRILLVAVALLAVALTGWALGARGGYDQTGGGPDPTSAPPQAAPTDPDGDTPAGDPPGTTQPAPRPRILGFGSEPVFPREGGFWRLPPGAGQAVLVTDARHATKVEFLLAPTGTGGGDLGVRIGSDSNGRDGWLAIWRYKDQPLLAHLTVRATGPGGTAEHTVGVYHPAPGEES
jgi:hypothetical protein